MKSIHALKAFLIFISGSIYLLCIKISKGYAFKDSIKKLNFLYVQKKTSCRIELSTVNSKQGGFIYFFIWLGGKAESGKIALPFRNLSMASSSLFYNSNDIGDLVTRFRIILFREICITAPCPFHLFIIYFKNHRCFRPAFHVHGILNMDGK